MCAVVGIVITNLSVNMFVCCAEERGLLEPDKSKEKKDACPQPQNFLDQA